jgi:molecular chaperone DnaK (HSP70)
MEFFDGKRPMSGINPDEAVAYGTAVQAAILSNQNLIGHDVTLVDVNPLTLGIKVVGGNMSIIIPRYTQIPNKKSDTFTTNEDNQKSVLIEVYEGENLRVDKNHLLGMFRLAGIRPAPKAEPQIEVTFDIDRNGILNVTAQDKQTLNKNNIVVNAVQNRFKPEEMQKMINDVKKHADRAVEAKAKDEAKSELEAMVYKLKSDVNSERKLGGKLSEIEKERVLVAVDEKIKWLDKSNSSFEVDRYKKQIKSLEKLMTPIMRRLNKNDNDEL